MSKEQTTQPRPPMGGGHGPGAVQPKGEKAKNFKSSMKKLLTYLGNYKFAILAVLIFAVASTVFSILGPKILGNATTEIVHGVMSIVTGTGSMNFAAIGNIILFMLCLYLLSSGLAYAQNFIITGVSMKVTYRLRLDISKKINRMPLAYFDR
ncbi:MAG: ABC transporter transmembrane domain-containing protein, partial [Oscillospiraceae bacterium]